MSKKGVPRQPAKEEDGLSSAAEESKGESLPAARTSPLSAAEGKGPAPLPSTAVGASSVPSSPVAKTGSSFVGSILGSRRKAEASNVADPSASMSPLKSAKKGPRVTPAEVIEYYVKESDGSEIRLAVLARELFDRFRWIKGEVPFAGEYFVNKGMRLLYANRRATAFERNGVPLPGPACLAHSQPVWVFIANTDSAESMVADSELICATVDQFERLLPGSQDQSNHCTYALTVLRLEATPEVISALAALSDLMD